MDFTSSPSLPVQKHLFFRPQSSVTLKKLREKLAILYSEFVMSVDKARSTPRIHLNTLFNKKRIGGALFVVVILLAVGIGIRMYAVGRARVQGVTSTTSLSGAKTVGINREFSIPVYDKDKALSNPIRYAITEAQLTKQIVIKGQKATAVAGRTFLIINLKLVNDFSESLFLNTRNYVRIQPAGIEDRLAPEIHNDTVEVQPLSTKMTRIGLPVNEDQTSFTLYVGEINGPKEEIPVSF